MPGRALRRMVLCILGLLIPLLLGGCPDFRNSVVDAADTATRDLIFNRQPAADAAATVADTIINASLDLFFDQFRNGGTTGGFRRGY